MFKFLKNDVVRILDETQNERVKLEEHRLYYSIQSFDDLKIFMENHVFAVWDFMSILKSLQSQLTCTSVPWIPSEKGTPARLVNEIVLEEETDIDQYGQYVSHFEMYCNAMVQVGADTGPIDEFLFNLINNPLPVALQKSRIPNPALEFVKSTFNSLDKAPAHVTAAIFTFGREQVIPDMFRSIISKMNRELKGKLKSFLYYIDRHISVDEDEHTPAALKMVKEICGNDEKKWQEATEAAQKTMSCRIRFWDGILSQIHST